MTSSICLPIKDGDLDTTIPASSKALILLAASPLPFYILEKQASQIPQQLAVLKI
jgi:hypothetical protein